MPGRIGCVHNKLISKHSADNLIWDKMPDFRRNKVEINTVVPSISSTNRSLSAGDGLAGFGMVPA